jgi:hypothetical protein
MASQAIRFLAELQYQRMDKLDLSFSALQFLGEVALCRPYNITRRHFACYLLSMNSNYIYRNILGQSLHCHYIILWSFLCLLASKHVMLSDIWEIEQNYNDYKKNILNISYLPYCGSSALLIWSEPLQTLSRIFLIPKETLKTTGQRMQWMNVAKFLKLWKKYTSLLYCTTSLSFGNTSLHQHVE